MNLLSASQISDKGFVTEIKKDSFECKLNGKVALTGHRNGSMFEVKSKLVVNSFLTTKVETLIKWHKRFGHLSFQMLRKHLKDKGLSFIDNESKCKSYIQGKMTRAEIPKSAQENSYVILEVVCSDVWGPSQTENKIFFNSY